MPWVYVISYAPKTGTIYCALQIPEFITITCVGRCICANIICTQTHTHTNTPPPQSPGVYFMCGWPNTMAHSGARIVDTHAHNHHRRRHHHHPIGSGVAATYPVAIWQCRSWQCRDQVTCNIYHEHKTNAQSTAYVCLYRSTCSSTESSMPAIYNAHATNTCSICKCATA